VAGSWFDSTEYGEGVMSILGNNEATTAFGDTNDAGVMTCCKYTVYDDAATGIVASIYGCAISAGVTQKFRVAVFADDAGDLGALCGVSSEITVDYNSGVPKWWAALITASLVAGDYWVVLLWGTGDQQAYIYSATSGGPDLYYAAPFWTYSSTGNPPSPGGAVSLGADGYAICMYVSYYGAGGGFVEGSSASSVGTTSLVVPEIPAGYVEDDDILIAFIEQLGTDAATVTWPDANWTEWGRNDAGGDGSSMVYLGWKRASSESGSYTFGLDAANLHMAHIVVGKGFKTSGDPANVALSNTNYNTNDTTVQAAALVPSVASILLFVAFATQYPTGMGSPEGAWNWIDASAYGDSYGVFFFALVGAVTGNTGVVAATLWSAATMKHAFMVALEPDTGGLSVPGCTLSQVGDDILVSW
jgi:hypothetical protein